MTAVRRIGIKQVASEAGVSAQTVSRVLNGRPDVATETRQRVQEIIERLGFQPSALARSLIQQRSDMLGVVSTGLTHIGPSRTLNGITQQAAVMSYAILLKELPCFDSPGITSTLQSLVARHVDGIIWAVPEVGNNRAWVLPERLHTLPPIIFLSMAPHNGISLITVDNREGARLATQHLINLGRRAIGFVGGPPDWRESRERQAGWEDALHQAGLPCDTTLAEDGDWSAASGERSFGCLLARRPDIDAIFAANDHMALGILRAAQLAGCRVPDDLAVVGFDDIPDSAFFWPPLTTVHQPLVDAGRLAVTELHHLIEARLAGMPAGEPSNIVLRPELVVRESSAGRAAPEGRTLRRAQGALKGGEHRPST